VEGQCHDQESAGEPVEEAAGAVEFGEALFFFAEFAGVGNESAAGASRGMLDVEHLVEQDIFDGALRNAGMIEAAVEQNLVGAGIVTAELASPAAEAPADMGFMQLAGEIFVIQLVEEFFQIEVPALRASGTQADTVPAHTIHAAARSARASVFEVRLEERRRRPASIDAGKQQRRSSFQHRKWRAAQQVREASVNHFFASANGQRQAGIRIKLDAEARRAAVAAKAREHTLKEGGASGKEVFGLGRVRHAKYFPTKSSGGQDPYWTHQKTSGRKA